MKKTLGNRLSKSFNRTDARKPIYIKKFYSILLECLHFIQLYVLLMSDVDYRKFPVNHFFH